MKGTTVLRVQQVSTVEQLTTHFSVLDRKLEPLGEGSAIVPLDILYCIFTNFESYVTGDSKTSKHTVKQCQ